MALLFILGLFRPILDVANSSNSFRLPKDLEARKCSAVNGTTGPSDPSIW